MTKYLEHDGAGAVREVNAATQGGVPNAGRIPELNAQGQLDPSMMPSGIGADTQVFQASEALAAGDLVNIHSVGGEFRVRKADASSGVSRKATGYVKESVASGSNATVFFEGTNDQLTGLTPGNVFLSPTQPGRVTQTVPTTAGHIVQRVGYAISATAYNLELSDTITLA